MGEQEESRRNTYACQGNEEKYELRTGDTDGLMALGTRCRGWIRQQRCRSSAGGRVEGAGDRQEIGIWFCKYRLYKAQSITFSATVSKHPFYPL